MLSQLESILFVAGKPLAVKRIAKALKIGEAEVEQALAELARKYSGDSGIVLLHAGDEWQLASNPVNRAAAENFIKAEISGELTRPQLETLTVISYCGPITKPELEQIRGVNCGLILRNLMMRGLVKEEEELINLLPKYQVTMEYLRQLGIQNVRELPEFQALHQHEFVSQALADNNLK